MRKQDGWTMLKRKKGWWWGWMEAHGFSAPSNNCWVSASKAASNALAAMSLDDNALRQPSTTLSTILNFDAAAETDQVYRSGHQCRPAAACHREASLGLSG